MKTRFYILITNISVFLPQAAYASNGLYFTGSSANGSAMGGAVVAAPQDAQAAAVNPAGMAYVGDRFDLDIQALYQRANVDVGTPDNPQKGHLFVAIPEVGFNKQINSHITFGVSTLPLGIGFYFNNGVAPGINKRTGVLLIQDDIIPTLTYKFDNGLAIGISAVASLQLFKIQGLPGPFPDGQFPAHGRKAAFGMSARVGAMWPVTNWLTLGASYAPKMKMSDLGGYKNDLLAGIGGSLDTPQRVEAGFAVQPVRDVQLSFGYEHLKWAGVKALNEGFGWRNQSVYKVGARFDVTDSLTIRAGFNHARRHIASDDAERNFLFVGVNSRATASIGASYKIGGHSEVKLTIQKDFDHPLVGTESSAGTRINTSFQTATVGYGYRF